VVGEQVDTLLASGILPALDRLDIVTTGAEDISGFLRQELHLQDRDPVVSVTRAGGWRWW
jgi:hypothetical protein